METILYSQYSAQLDLALMLNQITVEEYWEEIIRQMSVDLEVRGISEFESLAWVKK